MAEETDAPDCPPCEPCCKECCDPDCSCGEDCEWRIVIKPDDIPEDIESDCCGPLIEMEEKSPACSSKTIEACCNGIDGCDNEACLKILWRVCNKTNRCIEFFTIFTIAGLSKTDGGAPCPDEDTDCCQVQYRASTGAQCEFEKPGTTFEPNGIAPGPGFCLKPCSEATICVYYRVGTPAGECGCIVFADSPVGLKDCCEAVATVSDPCGQVCCTDNIDDTEQQSGEGCDSFCRESIEEFCIPPVDCPDCCGCCEPSTDDMETDGWTIVDQPTDCCEDIVAKRTNTDDWDCCETGDCTLASPANECEVDENNFETLYPCEDSDNDECDCELEPVPPSHPDYIAPCICNPSNVELACAGANDDCEWGSGFVHQGVIDDFGDCCYQQEREKVTEVCDPNPCSFADTPNSPCS